MESREPYLAAFLIGGVPAFRRIGMGIAQYRFENPKLRVRHVSERDLAELRPDRCRGLVAAVRDEAQAAELLALGIPIVNVSGRRPSPGIARVLADDHAAGRLAGEFLAGLGHRTFAYFSIGLDFSDRREAGFREVVAARAESYQRYDLPGHHPEAFAGEEWMDERVAALPSPCAVLVAQDDIAASILLSARRVGRAIGPDLAVLGINGDYVGDSFAGSMSTIDLPFERVGYEAVARLDRLAPGETLEPTTTFLPPLGLLARSSTGGVRVEDPLVRRALALLEEGPRAGGRALDLAQTLGVDRKTLYRRFLAAVGRTPRQELARRRIARAQELLLGSRLTVAEIAVRSGFSKESHFCTAFKEAVGLTPKQFRQQSLAAGAPATGSGVA